MKSLHALPLTVRSMVSTGMCLALACANAGASPSEFSGATISTCAPWRSCPGCRCSAGRRWRWLALDQVDAQLLGLVGDRLGLGGAERVAGRLGLGEPDDCLGQVQPRGAVPGEAARSAARATLGHLLLTAPAPAGGGRAVDALVAHPGRAARRPQPRLSDRQQRVAERVRQRRAWCRVIESRRRPRCRRRAQSVDQHRSPPRPEPAPSAAGGRGGSSGLLRLRPVRRPRRTWPRQSRGLPVVIPATRSAPPRPQSITDQARAGHQPDQRTPTPTFPAEHRHRRT